MRLCWRHHWYEVASLQDEWKVRGRHWYNEESRCYYQIHTADDQIMVVCQKENNDRWSLVKIIG